MCIGGVHIPTLRERIRDFLNLHQMATTRKIAQGLGQDYRNVARTLRAMYFAGEVTYYDRAERLYPDSFPIHCRYWRLIHG